MDKEEWAEIENELGIREETEMPSENDFEKQVYQDISKFVEEWNKERPTQNLREPKSMKLHGACEWNVDFVIQDTQGRLFAIIEVKSSNSPKFQTHKQHLDRAFVELCDLKFNMKHEDKHNARFYLLLSGVTMPHDYDKLFQSFGINVFQDSEWDWFISDIKDHILSVVNIPL